jgi:opacity protein-like surface antigen
LSGTNEYTADIMSWLGLANAYIDMGTWCGFTPYVGAGIGFATISVGNEGHQRAAGSAFLLLTTPPPTSPGPFMPA